MDNYTLGKAAVVSKGAWSASASYSVLNTVTHNGGSFMAIAPSSNIEPGVNASWSAYWVAMAKGIKTVTVTAVNTSTARVTITFSDGTSVVGGTYNTATVADGSITDAKIVSTGISRIADGAVGAAKLGTDILPSNVGIKTGTAVPTTADISNGQIYLKYES